MTKRTIAVMGATGHIGSVLTGILLAKGHEVRALGRDAAKLNALAAKGAKSRAVALSDGTALSDAFSGTEAAFVMIPPSYQDRSTEVIVQALRKAGVRKVVALSSVGAQHAQGTGPIKGLHRMEQRLRQSGGPDAALLRPSYFMENHLFSIPTIKAMGINGSSLKAGLALPQIATKDIAARAADLLDRADFKGATVHEFAGPKDLTMTEVTALLGQAIGNPDLRYVEFPYADAEKAMAGMGMPPATAALMVEMYRGINDGLVQFEKPLTAAQRTRTTLEDFAPVFAAAFKA